MIGRMKRLLVVVVAVSALGATGAPSALAIHWEVEGHELKSGEKESYSTSGKVIKEFVAIVSGVETVCTKNNSENSYIEGPAGGGAASSELSGCTTPGEGCEVGNEGKIKTVPLVMTLQAGPPIKLKIAPKEGTTLATVRLSGCSAEGVYAVKGSSTAEVLEPEVESLAHRFNFTPSSGSALSVGSASVQFTGETEELLASGKKWSAKK